MTQTLVSTCGSILVLERKEKYMMISGIVSALFIIIGIIIGITISLYAVAAFYSLFYIAFVLSYNIYFIYYRALKHSVNSILKFWLPRFVLSLVIWGCIYFEHKTMLLIGLFSWTTIVLMDSFNDLKKMLIIMIKKFK